MSSQQEAFGRSKANEGEIEMDTFRFIVSRCYYLIRKYLILVYLFKTAFVIYHLQTTIKFIDEKLSKGDWDKAVVLAWCTMVYVTEESASTVSYIFGTLLGKVLNESNLFVSTRGL